MRLKKYCNICGEEQNNEAIRIMDLGQWVHGRCYDKKSSVIPEKVDM